MKRFLVLNFLFVCLNTVNLFAQEKTVIEAGDGYIEVIGEEAHVVAPTTISQALDVILRQIKSRQNSNMTFRDEKISVEYINNSYVLNIPGEALSYTSITELRKDLKKYLKSKI